MALNKKKIKVDFCVIGGGMAGYNAAITAARLGVKVALIHERPVFGGNASGEIRMWVCGAMQDGYAYKETGLTEELQLENYLYNPTKNPALWDALLYGKAKTEKNLISLLNCTCFDAKMDAKKIKSVTAYQMTTQTLFEIEADTFADCSGDSILAPLTGAEFMYGREGKDEYGEPMSLHESADKKTMGNSCLIQARKTGRKVVYRAPAWAEKVPLEKLKSRNVNLYNPTENFWYIEIGGETDVIGQAETLNERLLALCLGVWDTIKNSGEYDADEFDLEFLGFLGAKRESRRMKGDYVLTANDILDGGKFPDTVAYGGWPLDDHNPLGFDGDIANTNVHLNTVYGIPYRCLYSKNIENLFFAGRNISATHMAMSSARVMGTCSVIGQAVGAGASLTKKYAVNPRGVGAHMDELQQLLLKCDCYLSYIKRKVDEINNVAVLTAGKEGLKQGVYRGNAVTVQNGERVGYQFQKPTRVGGVKMVFDSDLQRLSFGDMHITEKHRNIRAVHLENSPVMEMPKTLAKVFSVEIVNEKGEREVLLVEQENAKRNVLLPIKKKVKEIMLTVYENWGGSAQTNVFAFELYE